MLAKETGAFQSLLESGKRLEAREWKGRLHGVGRAGLPEVCLGGLNSPGRFKIIWNYRVIKIILPTRYLLAEEIKSFPFALEKGPMTLSRLRGS